MYAVGTLQNAFNKFAVLLRMLWGPFKMPLTMCCYFAWKIMGGAHPIFIHSWINILRDVLRAVPRCGVRADTFNGNIWLSCLSASHTVYDRQEV